jgi:hypothetical protein
MTYKSRQYSEKDEHKLMEAIIAQKKSYNNEQERKKTTNVMTSNTLLGETEGTVANEIINLVLVMASDTQVTQDHNINNYELCVDSNDISQKGEFEKPSMNNDHYIEEDRLDFSNECNKWEGGGIRNNNKHEKNRMLENYVCNDIIRNNEVANILLLLNRENTLDNSCYSKKDKKEEGGNKGDIYCQFDAGVKMSARELGKDNISEADKCGVDDCDGELSEHSKAIMGPRGTTITCHNSSAPCGEFFQSDMS